MYTDMVGVVHIHADILDSPLFLFMLIDQVNISNYFSLLGCGCFKKKKQIPICNHITGSILLLNGIICFSVQVNPKRGYLRNECQYQVSSVLLGYMYHLSPPPHWSQFLLWILYSLIFNRYWLPTLIIFFLDLWYKDLKAHLMPFFMF